VAALRFLTRARRQAAMFDFPADMARVDHRVESPQQPGAGADLERSGRHGGADEARDFLASCPAFVPAAAAREECAPLPPGELSGQWPGTRETTPAREELCGTTKSERARR